MQPNLLLKIFSSRARHLGAALVLGLAAMPAWALPVMDMQAEDLMPMVAEVKKTLNLNPNQQTLWQQTESKTRQLLRERQSRRERLQAAGKTALDGHAVELRDLVGAVDAETAAAALEEKQMREWWLTVNDALSESQRRAVAALVAEQLMRVADHGARDGGAPRVRGDGGEQNRGGRHQQGGAGGMPGG